MSNTNPESAILECQKLVDDDSKITVDVLLSGNSRESKTLSEDDKKTVGNWIRGRTIKYNYGSKNSLAQTIKAFTKDF